MKLVKALALSLALLGTTNVALAECYSEGIRTGNVQKLSRKGYVNKSWEGEMVQEGTKIRGANGIVKGGDVWLFSVLDAKVAAEIETAMMMSSQVIVKYCQANPLNPAWKLTSSTPYTIISAKVVQK